MTLSLYVGKGKRAGADVMNENSIISYLSKQYEKKEICTYKENKQKVEEIIDKICSKTLNAKIFDVLNKIVNKETKEGIKLLDNILAQKESIIKIYIMLYKQIKQMYMIKYLKQKNENDIAAKLGIHPYTFKLLNTTCNKYTYYFFRKTI